MNAARASWFASLASCCVLAVVAHAKDITLPPDGDNQFSSVSQGIGLVRVTVQYNSPDVHGPDGADRSGKIWGALVPYGLHDLGYNNCTQCPWRAGSNENTVFTVSHPVKIEGQPLPAGSYGLHMIAGKDEWTVIFSKNSTSWGSFWYDPAEDQLRVQVKPSECEYHEWLTYEFTDRRSDRATVALKWDRLQVPITITVDDMPGLYVAQLREEFRNAQAFTGWYTWQKAAEYCLVNKTHMDQGLAWAQEAASRPGTGIENFQTLATLGRLQIETGKADEGKRTLDRAIAHPTADPVQVHQMARTLQGAGKNDEARELFLANAKRFPNRWPVNVGLARAYAMSGDTKKAVSYANKAKGQAPDDQSKRNLDALIQQIEATATAKR
jgi:tetratricopeptide (TPR) repeat protein